MPHVLLRSLAHKYSILASIILLLPVLLMLLLLAKTFRRHVPAVDCARKRLRGRSQGSMYPRLVRVRCR